MVHWDRQQSSIKERLHRDEAFDRIQSAANNAIKASASRLRINRCHCIDVCGKHNINAEIDMFIGCICTDMNVMLI